MTKLKLITTEAFGDLNCNFYRNMNNDILLTREQIGTALEYSNPSRAIQKMHLKHKDRLENLCTRIKDIRCPQNGGVGVEVETIYYTERGVMEICRWSRQKKANEFMDWVWNIVESYREGNIFTNKQVAETLNAAANSITSLTEIASSLAERISALEAEKQDDSKSELPPPRPYNPWFFKMHLKYELLENYFNITRGNLHRNILLEPENNYHLDTQQIQADYCYENNLTSCYPMEPFQFVPKYRNMIEEIVNNCLIRKGIADEDDIITSTKPYNNFQQPG